MTKATQSDLQQVESQFMSRVSQLHGELDTVKYRSRIIAGASPGGGADDESPTFPSNLVAQWDFDQNLTGVGPGLVAQGSTGINGDTLTYVPGPTASQTAIRIDGTISSSVVFPEVLEFNLDAFTLSVWIKTTDAGGDYRGVIIKHYGYGFFLRSNKMATFDWSRSARIDGTTALNDGQWHHLVMSKAAGNPGTMVFWIDGVVELTDVYGIDREDTTLTFGAGDAPGEGQIFNGDIADIKIFNTVLTPSEI